MILFYKLKMLQFISDLFNDAVSSLDCIAPNDINEMMGRKGHRE
jgi:hypothetical protein